MKRCRSAVRISSSEFSTRQSAGQRYSFKPGKNPNAVQIQANGKIKVPVLFPTMGVPIDFRPIKTAICTQTELDVALVIDRSGSMAYGVNEIASNLSAGRRAIGLEFRANCAANVALVGRCRCGR